MCVIAIIIIKCVYANNFCWTKKYYNKILFFPSFIISSVVYQYKCLLYAQLNVVFHRQTIFIMQYNMYS